MPLSDYSKQQKCILTWGILLFYASTILQKAVEIYPVKYCLDGHKVKIRI